MNEAEWLASEDPAAMLEYLRYSTYEEMGGVTQQSRHQPLITDRQLQRWVDACATLYLQNRLTTKSLCDGTIPLEIRVQAVIQQPVLPPQIVAAMLREVIGNPFRSHPFARESEGPLWRADQDVTSFDVPSVIVIGEKPNQRAFLKPRWLTDDVRDMALGIREGRECEKCKGRQWMGIEYAAVTGESALCDACSQTGRVIDQAAFPILADALDDAGLENEEVLRHLRGFERCPCLGEGEDSGGVTPWGESIYLPCGLECQNGWIPLRCPHVAGCWVLSLILGEQ